MTPLGISKRPKSVGDINGPLLQGNSWGPRRKVAEHVGGCRGLKTYCGSGGRWFESTQLYQRNQSLRQCLLANCPPNVDNGKRTVIKDHGFDSGGNSVFGFEAIRGRGGLTGNRTARLGERETRSTGSLGGPRRFAHQALSCKGERSS